METNRRMRYCSLRSEDRRIRKRDIYSYDELHHQASTQKREKLYSHFAFNFLHVVLIFLREFGTSTKLLTV